MTKGEKFLEKEGIDDMIIAVNEKGEQVFVSDLIDKALNEQLILSGVVKSDSEPLVLFADWLQYNGKWSLPEQQAKDFLKEQQEQN